MVGAFLAYTNLNLAKGETQMRKNVALTVVIANALHKGGRSGQQAAIRSEPDLMSGTREIKGADGNRRASGSAVGSGRESQRLRRV
jgi:hypothetical protein